MTFNCRPSSPLARWWRQQIPEISRNRTGKRVVALRRTSPKSMRRLYTDTSMIKARDIAYQALDAMGANRLAFRAKSRLRILCYHGAWLTKRAHFGDKLFIGVDTFRSRLEQIARLRCNVMPLTEAMQALSEGTLPKKAIVITIDDGWASTFDFMLPELEKHAFPATVYLQTEKLLSESPVHDVAIAYALQNSPVTKLELPAFIRQQLRDPNCDKPAHELADERARASLAESLVDLMDNSPPESRNSLLEALFEILQTDPGILADRQFHLASPREVQIAASAGFEMALHTHTHSLGDFSPTRVAAEINANRSALSSITGQSKDSFRNFCWPSGDYTITACESLRTLGVDSATTCEYGLMSPSTNPMLIPRILDGERTSSAAFKASLSGAKEWFIP